MMDGVQVQQIVQADDAAIEKKECGLEIKLRMSSVKRFIRVVKKKFFMSYDVMAVEKFRNMFIPIDPERVDSVLNDDIIIMCNKEKVRCLSGVKYILINGTFKVAPHEFIHVHDSWWFW